MVNFFGEGFQLIQKQPLIANSMLLIPNDVKATKTNMKQ